MPSFGEAEITADSCIIGKVRVAGILPGASVLPRLRFLVDLSLREIPDELFPPGMELRNLELRDLSGELRLKEDGDIVGPLQWTGPRRPIRSSSLPIEHSIELTCELGVTGIEAIENRRAAGEPIFWIALWPSLYDDAGTIECRVYPIRTVVPRDRWVEYINTATGSKRAIVEVEGGGQAESEFLRTSKEGNRKREAEPDGMDSRKVFVVYGHDRNLVDSLFNLLRAGGLDPVAFERSVVEAGGSSRYVGDIIDHAMKSARAIVILFSGDEEAALISHLAGDRDERGRQPRQNVLFEAGLALGLYPDRTLIVAVGELRTVSDLSGRHLVHLDDSPEKRKALLQRLEAIGCFIEWRGDDWLRVGSFA